MHMRTNLKKNKPRKLGRPSNFERAVPNMAGKLKLFENGKSIYSLGRLRWRKWSAGK
jgi:hypothetical protein